MDSTESGTATGPPTTASPAATSVSKANCDEIAAAPPDLAYSSSPSALTATSPEGSIPPPPYTETDEPKPKVVRERRLSVAERMGFVFPKDLNEGPEVPRTGRRLSVAEKLGFVAQKDLNEGPEVPKNGRRLSVAEKFGFVAQKDLNEGSEVPENGRRLSVAERFGFVVPKDLSEGLSNPVFINPQNPEDERRNNCNNNSNNGHLPNTPSFTSLDSYGHSASRTALYLNNNPDFDSEKGPPPSSGRNSIQGSSKDEKKKKDSGEYKGIKRYLGLILTFSASFCFSLVVLFVKILKDYGFDAYGASFWRYAGTVVPTIPLLLFYECGPGVKKQDSVFTGVWPIFRNENWKTWLGLLSRGLIGSTSVILRYYALQYLTIADTSVITYSTPVLVTVLAHFFLKEKCGVFSILVAFVTLCGVIIVTKPPILTGEQEFDTQTLIGTGFACGSLFCSALIVIITRKIRAVHFTVMTLVFGIIGVAQALTLTYFMGHFNLPTELFDTLLLAGVSSISFLGQMAIVLALKFEQAGPVALIRSCDVLFGFLFQYVFLNVAPDMFSAIGGAIVLSCVLSIGFRKWLNTLPPDHKQRRRWWFILK